MFKRLANKIMEKVSFGKIIQLIVEAERLFKDFKGKAGDKKREYVIDKMVDFINIPFLPSFVTKEVEKVLYGLIIDTMVYMFNTIRKRVPTEVDDIVVN